MADSDGYKVLGQVMTSYENQYIVKMLNDTQQFGKIYNWSNPTGSKVNISNVDKEYRSYVRSCSLADMYLQELSLQTSLKSLKGQRCDETCIVKQGESPVVNVYGCSSCVKTCKSDFTSAISNVTLKCEPCPQLYYSSSGKNFSFSSIEDTFNKLRKIVSFIFFHS